jgi:hypothetical protein
VPVLRKEIRSNADALYCPLHASPCLFFIRSDPVDALDIAADSRLPLRISLMKVFNICSTFS